MKITLSQTNLFAEKTVVTQSYNVPAKEGPVKVSFLAGLDKNSLKTNSIYMLRVIAGQYLRNQPLNQKDTQKFLQTMIDEIKIKRGVLSPELATMNSLHRRYFS